jgi:hypothetical protein
VHWAVLGILERKLKLPARLIEQAGGGAPAE